MRVIGLMSGTSHDGIDAAAVDFALEGDTLRGNLLSSHSQPYEPSLRRRLMGALPPAVPGFKEVCQLDADIGQAFAATALDTLAGLPSGADLICSHGQTVFHGALDGHVWGTLQLGQPAWIAERTGLPVVSDLRNRDVAAGGQGAPLVSLLDLLILADVVDDRRPVAALNLGGIANVTVLTSGHDPIAYDIGPANALIDAAALQISNGFRTFDEDGIVAARGIPDPGLLERLLDEPYYRLPPPKTTGTELFNGGYLRAHSGGVGGDDLLATVTALTAELIARELRGHRIRRVIVSGGGVRNPTLMAWLAARLPEVVVDVSDSIGLPADAKEAVAFALLGWMTIHGLPGSVASCSGAVGNRVLGAITPGSEALRLPPVAAMPSRLVLQSQA